MLRQGRLETYYRALRYHGGEMREKLERIPPEVLIFFSYFLFVVFVTWPLLVRINSSVYGFPSDNLGGIWTYWWMRTSGFAFCPIIGYPFGVNLGFFSMDILSLAFARGLLFVFNEVVTFNIEVLLSLFLSGVTMYYLVRYLTGDRRVAYFGGLAFMLVPYHTYIIGLMGGGIIALQWLPLYILMLLKFIKTPTVRRCAWLGVSALLVAGTSIQNGMIMGILTLAFLLGRFLYRWKNKEHPFSVNWRTLALSLAVVALVLGLVVLPTYIGLRSQSGVQGQWETTKAHAEIRTAQASRWSSAHPSNYLSPSSRSVLFKLLNMATSKTPSVYSMLYLGWTVMILALMALLIKKHGDAGSFWGFVAVVPVAIIVSFGPLKGVPTPAALLRAVSPMFRWYLRIGLAAIIAFIVVACYGLKSIIEGLKRWDWKLVLVPLTALMVLEFLLVPPFFNYDLGETPRLFEEVRKLPEGSAVVYYPLDEPGTFLNSEILFYQRKTGKPMLNGAYGNTDGEVLRRTVINPLLPEVPSILKRFDLDYAIFLRNECGFDPTKLPAGFREINRVPSDEHRLDNAYVYEIDSRPADLVPLYLKGISLPVIETGTSRLVTGEGQVKVLNYTGAGVQASFSLPVIESLGEYDVTVTAGGREAWRKRFTAGGSGLIEFDLEIPNGGTDIDIRVEGKPFVLSDDVANAFGLEEATLKIGNVSVLEKQ